MGTAELLSGIERALAQARDANLGLQWRAEARRQLARLTARQRQIMDLVLAGHPQQEYRGRSRYQPAHRREPPQRHHDQDRLHAIAAGPGASRSGRVFTGRSSGTSVQVIAAYGSGVRGKARGTAWSTAVGGRSGRLTRKWRSLRERETALGSWEISNYSDLADYKIQERHRIVTTIITAIATCHAGGIGSSEFKWAIAFFGYSATSFGSFASRPEPT